jgi:hypothetical protein
MIAELDETIRQLLLREGGLAPSDVDVSFELPNREWSMGISKPTLNCYLFDIRENRDLRQSGMTVVGGGTREAARHREPVRVSVTYLITAWTRQVEDEHRLLAQALYTLIRFPSIPDELRVGALQQQQHPLRTAIIQPDGVLKSPGEFWTALENHLKPSLSYVVNLALEVEKLPAGPPVFVQGMRFHAPLDGLDQMMAFGGVVRNKQGDPMSAVEVRVEGHRGPVFTDDKGRYRLRVPGPGSYTLVARVNGTEKKRSIVIPEPDFDVGL